MFKFFFDDCAGFILLCLFILGGFFMFKSQWLYGGLAWLALLVYMAATVIYGLTYTE